VTKIRFVKALQNKVRGPTREGVKKSAPANAVIGEAGSRGTKT